LESRIPGLTSRVPASPAEGQQVQVQEAQELYTWLQKRLAAPGWQEKSDDTKRSLIQEERERIVGTRFGRVARIRRKAEPVVSRE
jgi:hypothetical protein